MTDLQLVSILVTVLLAGGANLFAIGRWQMGQQTIMRRLDQVEQRLEQRMVQIEQRMVEVMVEICDLARRIDRIEKERT